MDRLNQCFQTLLFERDFLLKTEEEAEHFTYKGRLSIQDRLVDFGVRVPKTDDRDIVQIVFEGIWQVEPDQDFAPWYRLMNELNEQQGLHFYYCMKSSGAIFARYMVPLAEDDVYLVLDLIRLAAQSLAEGIRSMSQLQSSHHI